MTRASGIRPGAWKAWWRCTPTALIRGLAGRAQGRSHYYPTQGSALRELLVAGERLYVQTCVAYAIALTGGGDRGMSATERTGEDGAPIFGASCDLAPFRGSYCRITVVDQGEPQTLGQPYLA
jgi:hypothetical protein